MAELKTNRQERGQERSKYSGQGLARPESGSRGLQRWQSSSLNNPFELIDRMTDEMDRVFNRVFRDFGVSRRPSPLHGQFGALTHDGVWTPRLEAFQNGDRFIVRAELPGLKKDDVQVELTDDVLTIQGERREERQEEREGFYQSERDYGQFHRTIPLPDGVIAESAQASFRNGILEVTMQAAPAEANRGRRVEIKDESSQGGDPRK